MPLIELTVPAGALTEEGRAGVQRALAGALLRWEGAPDTAFSRSVAWSYLHELPAGAQTTAEDGEPRFREQPEGTWGAGGAVVPRADLVALAEKARADA